MKGFIVVALILLLLGFFFINRSDAPTSEVVGTDEEETITDTDTDTDTESDSNKSQISEGDYTVDVEASKVNWAGKKPLIDGYTNSGTLDLIEGNISVTDNNASGNFSIDMETLKVGLTAKKLDQETALEGHLKGERWFDVATYPTATFMINSIEVVSAADFTYNINGELTMKGETHDVVFPATIYENADGVLMAEASTEIDRTKWNITAGSGSFFDNLADNVIDDMISLSFVLVANQN